MNVAVELAIHEASRSLETFRHGAVVLCGNRIIATGRNKNVNPCGLSSIHAEMNALWKVRDATDVHVVVVRLRRVKGRPGVESLACSKPCKACQNLMRRRGVGRVTFSTGDSDQPFQTLHFSSDFPF